MSLDNVGDKLEECIDHMKRTDSRGTVIEDLLKKSILIEMCGECEKNIEKTIGMRAKRSGDGELEAFVKTTASMQRHLKLEDVAGLISRFSTRRKKEFLDRISKDSKDKYSTMIDNRNSSSHGGTINITLDELLDYHENARRVMAAFSDAMLQEPRTPSSA